MSEKSIDTHQKKNSLLIYGDYANYIAPLNLTERGKLFTALLCYARDGDHSEEANELCKKRMTALVYHVIKSQADRERKRYEEVCQKNRDNARARYVRSHATACETAATACHKDTDTETDTDTDTDTDTETDPSFGATGTVGGSTAERRTGDPSPSGAKRGSTYPKRRGSTRTSYRQEQQDKYADGNAASFNIHEAFARALERSYGKQ